MASLMFMGSILIYLPKETRSGQLKLLVEDLAATKRDEGVEEKDGVQVLGVKV